jgi:hypothetical protein
MKELFSENTVEIINLLWNLKDEIYSANSQKEILNQPNNDLLEEIYKDKEKPRKLSNQNVQNSDDKSHSKPPQRDRYRNKYDSNRRDYERGDKPTRYRSRDYDNRRFDDERGRQREDQGRTMHVGGKRIVLKRKDEDSEERSKSGSQDKKDSYRRDEDSNLEKGGEQMYDREADFEGRKFYPQDRFYVQRGFYPPMRRFMRGGRFGAFMNPGRFIDPRR